MFSSKRRSPASGGELDAPLFFFPVSELEIILSGEGMKVMTPSWLRAEGSARVSARCRETIGPLEAGGSFFS